MGLRSLAGLTMPDWSWDRDQTKNSPWCPPGGGGLGGGPITHLSLKTKQIIKNFKHWKSTFSWGHCGTLLKHDALGPRQEDAQELTKPLVNLMAQLRVGNWNVKTMYPRQHGEGW